MLSINAPPAERNHARYTLPSVADDKGPANLTWADETVCIYEFVSPVCLLRSYIGMNEKQKKTWKWKHFL